MDTPDVSTPPPTAPVAADSHGSYDREPAHTHRSISLQLRRAEQSYPNRTQRVTLWQSRVTTLTAALDTAATDPQKVAAQTKLARANAKLVTAQKALAFADRRIAAFQAALAERTLKNRATVNRFGTATFEALAERSADTRDASIVQAHLPEADAAMTRILTRVAPKMGKLIRKRVQYELGRNRDRKSVEAEVKALAAAGIYAGVLDYDAQHKSGARLSTRCYWPAMRNLQPRTRADRAIGATKTAEGWLAGAASLDALSDGFEEAAKSCTPLVTNHAANSLVSAAGVTRQQTEQTQVAVDVQKALAALDPQDRALAVAVHVHETPLRTVAAQFGLTPASLKKKLTAISEVMSDALADYSDWR